MKTLCNQFRVTCHTDYVGAGTTFVAIAGGAEDGGRYIPYAIARGAKSVVIDRACCINDEVQCALDAAGIIPEYVDDARLRLAELSAAAYEFPADKLKIIGITGTKGKTTSSYLLFAILRMAGHKVALLSSAGNWIGGAFYESSLTTPQPDYTHAFFHKCVQEGVEWIVMEVAAQALTLQRVAGITFQAALFTNLSQEHGEFYPTTESYFSAKMLLVQQLSPAAPLVANGDDERLKARLFGNKLVTFGTGKAVDYRAISIKSEFPGMSLIVHHDEVYQRLYSPGLIGRYNGINITGVAACAHQCGVSFAHIKRALESVPEVPGRQTWYQMPTGASVCIDYAHNPASYEAILSTLRLYTKHLIVVFGTGGDRDRARRPLMGSCAARYADEIILTSDNPRSEDPENIITDILAGIDPEQRSGVRCILDRRVAISEAVTRAHQGTIIAVLGKGAEGYQIIGDTKYPHEDSAVVKQLGGYKGTSLVFKALQKSSMRYDKKVL